MVVGGLSGSVVMRRELVDGTFSCIGVLAAASARRLWIVVGAAAPPWSGSLLGCEFDKVFIRAHCVLHVSDELF